MTIDMKINLLTDSGIYMKVKDTAIRTIIRCGKAYRQWQFTVKNLILTLFFIL